MIKIKPIKPKRPIFDPRRQQQAVWGGLKDANDEAVKDFESTADSWDHKPTFTSKKQADGYLIGTDDDIWNILDKGSKPHTIVASKIALRFKSGRYRAKTRPGFIGSTAGGSSGGPVFRRVVHHPGTKPRGWSKLIKRKWDSRLSMFVQKRISEAMR